MLYCLAYYLSVPSNASRHFISPRATSLTCIGLFPNPEWHALAASFFSGRHVLSANSSQ